jgi:hypothetical protein
MRDPLSAGEPRPGDTTAQLKHDIDCGLTGDRSGGFDPAAAPLGTDDEAAGHRLPPELIAQTRAQARAGAADTSCANGACPDLAPDAELGRQRGLALVAAAGLAAGLALAVLVAAAL